MTKRRGRSPVIALMLQHGADPTKKVGCSPFGLVCDGEAGAAAALARQELAASATEVRNRFDRTPAHFAACRGDAKELAGMKLQPEDEDSDSFAYFAPLYLAAAVGSAPDA